MKITAYSPGVKTFKLRGETLSVGQLFRGLKVFALGQSHNFFVRTPGGALGRLVGSGVNSTLLGKLVDVKLAAYELKGAGLQAQAFIDFELVMPEPAKQVPPMVQPNFVAPSVTVQETAYVAAKRLNREINRHGLNEERRLETEQTLLAAVRELGEFTAEIRIGWTKQLVSSYSEKQELAALVDKLRRHLGAEPLAYQLPDIRKIKDFSLLPLDRAPQEAAEEAQSVRPDMNLYAVKNFVFFSTEIPRLKKVAATASAATWALKDLTSARDLVRWLNYLLAAGPDKLREEYPETSDWPATLVNGYLEYLATVREQIVV